MADDFYCDPKVWSPDYLFSSMKIGDWYRMDDYTDMSFDGCDDYLNLNWEWKRDVLNMLPSDPFEMNISGGCTMIRGWIQEVDDDIGYIKIGDEINFDDTNGVFLFDGSKESNNHGKKVSHTINKRNSNCCQSEEKDVNNGDNHVSAPPDALFFALGHLGLRDLFSVERVCKSLRDGVRNDPLLWRNVHVDQQPGELFTDESLLRITKRASGSLQSLSLVKCFKITDHGLKNVFQQNPGLTKLSLLGCNGLTIEGLLSNLTSLKTTTGGGGIKRLRIGSLYSITMDQFEALKKSLSIDNKNHLTSPKPRFYNGGQSHLSLEDDRPIDIEACPKCHQLRQVYDCPAETCQKRRYCCRACTFCIPRCINCGCCLNERGYMETFCLDFLCLVCIKQILGFPDGGEDEEDISVHSMQNGFHQQASYHLCFYG